MTTRFLSRRLFRILAPVALMTAAACEKEDSALVMADLSGDEFVFVERMVILERAKAVALLDPEAGDALLDSLNTAWGDSSLQATLSGAPTKPLRAQAVAALLRRVLVAEQESLKTTSGLDRLTKPLPDPLPEPPPAPPGDDPES